MRADTGLCTLYMHWQHLTSHARNMSGVWLRELAISKLWYLTENSTANSLQRGAFCWGSYATVITGKMKCPEYSRSENADDCKCRDLFGLQKIYRYISGTWQVSSQNFLRKSRHSYSSWLDIFEKLPAWSSLQNVRITLPSYPTCPLLKVFSLVLI